jgi:CBS domain-containing protein
MSDFAMPVSSFMSAPVLTIAESATLSAAYARLRDRRVSCLAVTSEDGRAVGVISRTDLLRVGRTEARAHGGPALLELPDARVRAIMHRSVIAVPPTAPIAAAARAMVSERVHRVFVMDGPALVGVLSTKDLLLAIRDKRVGTPIAEVMSAPAFTIPTGAPLSLAADRLQKAHVTGLCVVDDEEWPVGTFTQQEALSARDLPADAHVDAAMSYAMLCLDAHVPLFRAAAQAHATRTRRVLVVANRKVRGVITGLDFARAATTM